MNRLLANEQQLALPDFIEVAPENWIAMGGRYAAQLHEYAERFPIVAHGLSFVNWWLKISTMIL